MKWTFEEYLKEAEKTADYVNNDYPFISYYEEVGELIGKLSKGWLRGDYVIVKEKPTDESVKYILAAEILKELGDICWMQALTVKECFLSRPDFVSFNSCKVIVSHSQCIDAVLSLINCRSLNYVFETIEIIANYFGSSLDEVLTMNIEKLKSRKERGVIKANGDNR